MNYVIKILKKNTMNLFNDEWYEQTASEILNNKEIDKDGYVYFVKNGEKSKHVKIGCTSDILKRLTSFKTVFHNGVYLIGFIKTKNYLNLEREIHLEFEEKRSSGEFFKLNHIDLSVLNTLYDIDFKMDYFKLGHPKDMINKTFVSSTKDMLLTVRSLEKNKQYSIEDVMSVYENVVGHPTKESKAWFGRNISKCIQELGYIKKINTNNSVRTFSIQ